MEDLYKIFNIVLCVVVVFFSVKPFWRMKLRGARAN